MRTSVFVLPVCLAGLGLAAACAPTVKVEAPDKPIEINMNIKIQQEVRVRVERDLDNVIANDPALFGVSDTASGKEKAK